MLLSLGGQSRPVTFSCEIWDIFGHEEMLLQQFLANQMRYKTVIPRRERHFLMTTAAA